MPTNNNRGIHPFFYLLVALMSNNEEAKREVYSSPCLYAFFVDADMRCAQAAITEMYMGPLASMLGSAVLRPEYIHQIIVQLGNDPQIGNQGKGTIWDWAGVPRHEQIGTNLRPIISFK